MHYNHYCIHDLDIPENPGFDCSFVDPSNHHALVHTIQKHLQEVASIQFQLSSQLVQLSPGPRVSLLSLFLLPLVCSLASQYLLANYLQENTKSELSIQLCLAHAACMFELLLFRLVCSVVKRQRQHAQLNVVHKLLLIHKRGEFNLFEFTMLFRKHSRPFASSHQIPKTSKTLTKTLGNFQKRNCSPVEKTFC